MLFYNPSRPGRKLRGWERDSRRNIALFYLNGKRISEVNSINVLGLIIEGNGSNKLTLQKITGKVENALRIFRRILNRNRGISEVCAISRIHAFVLCHISYVEAMLNSKETEAKRLVTIIRQIFKIALGLAINASTDLLLKLGVHNTLLEIAEAQHTARLVRLSGVRAGRDILVTLGIFIEQNKDSVRHLSKEKRDPIVVLPYPRNAHSVFNQGRRLTREKALITAALESPTESAFVDAAQISGRQAFSTAVNDDHERMCNALSVFTKNAEVAKRMTIALALLDPKHTVIHSDLGLPLEPSPGEWV